MIIYMHTKMRMKWKGKKSYTEETSGGVTREGLGNFSSKTPTITSESEIHLSSSIFISGTFPSGLMSKNLKNPSQKTLQKQTTNRTLKISSFLINLPLGLGLKIDQMQLVLNFLLFQSHQNPLAERT